MQESQTNSIKTSTRKYILIFAPILTFAFGLSLGVLNNSLSNNNLKDSRQPQSNYPLINPLLECDSEQNITNLTLNRAKSKIESIIQKAQKTKEVSSVSVYIRDFTNGSWIGINENEKFTLANPLEIPLLIAYLKLSETEPNILNTTPLNNHSEENSESIQSMLGKTITHSDASAKESLANYLSQTYPSLLPQIYKDLNLETKITPVNSPISVKDYSALFRILYNASYLTRNNSENALKLLTQTTYNKAIKAGIPSDVKLAHNSNLINNENEKLFQLTDCGIIYLPGKPYLLCVTAKGNNLGNLEQIISQISSTTYYIQESALKK